MHLQAVGLGLLPSTVMLGLLLTLGLSSMKLEAAVLSYGVGSAAALLQHNFLQIITPKPETSSRFRAETIYAGLTVLII